MHGLRLAFERQPAGSSPAGRRGRPVGSAPVSDGPNGPSEPDETDGGIDELPEQMRVRRAKLDRLRESAIDPYPVTVPRTTTLAAVRAAHPDLEPDTMTGEQVGVTGRVIFFRNTGKLCFATLREGDAELQVMLSRDRVGEESLAAWKADVDLGDHVLVTGEVGTSRRGELSVFADSWQLTAKALRPLPVAHKPMSEELRVRRRYVDLIVRDEARRTVRQRATVMSSLRAGLTARGYLEVETPMLQTVHGGAAARPFRTHMNAFDLDLYLRIAPELFLKRCIVGGLDRVFEINRNFRNEGADSSHSPEFAMLEAYQAYADYQEMATRHPRADPGRLGGPVRRPHRPAPRRHRGRPVRRVAAGPALHRGLGGGGGGDHPGDAGREAARGRRAARRRRRPAWLPGKVVEEIFEALVQDSLQAPTFVIDYPVDTSPLTRAHRSTPGPGREVGPLHRRHRAGDGLLRAGRPGGAARAVHRPGGAGRGRRPRGDGAGRGLPARRSSTECRPPAVWGWAWTG